MLYKIVLVYVNMLALILFAFPCNAQGIKSGSKPHNATDTILYAKDGVVVPNLARALGRYVSTLTDPKGLIFHSTGAGKSVWIDSVYADRIGSKGLFMIARTVESIAAISYNGDSLNEILIHPNLLQSLRTAIKGDERYSYVKVTDSMRNSGFIIRNVFYFKVDRSGRLLGSYSSAPSRRMNERRFDFAVSDSLYPEHLVIKEYYPAKDSLARINL